MTYSIYKAGVIGSGTMGSGIAALLAGVGIPVVLLDIAAKNTQPGDPPGKRNAVVLDNLAALKKSRPAQLFEPTDIDLITVGNLGDDLGLLATVDWIIEVIVEKLDVKQELMAKIEEVRRPGTIISSNTSGLSIHAIARGRSAEFRQHFLGTHFFNPPRYLHLLEVIPGDDTDPALVEFFRTFGAEVLGKGVVVTHDTPNFIANRFISVVGNFATAYAIRNGYTVEETDMLTGPLIGHPRSGTFRLSDIVGNDISLHVALNLYDAIPNDEAREIIKDAEVMRVYNFLMEKRYLGNKTGQGFYKRVDGPDGDKQFWPLDLQTLDYVPPKQVRFESVGKHRKIEDTGARIKALINETDRAAQYIWHLHAFYLAYASRRIGDISDSIEAIDNANKWGFAHEMGPFEIWDAIGVRETVPRMEADGYPVAPWVKAMLAQGIETFYQRDTHGNAVSVYDAQTGAYTPRIVDKDVVILRDLKRAGRTIQSNSSAALIDLGDGVALIEFTTKVNALDEDIFNLINSAIDRAEKEFTGLVIGNQGELFCGGANLFLFAMLAQSGQFNQLDHAIRYGQQTMQHIRFSPKPVVVAPFDRTLGGGVEMSLAAARIVAHAELYMGLVELGVGLIPGWGGCKETLRRVVTPVMLTPNADPLPHLQKAFENIALAKVSESAKQARAMGYLQPGDRIVMNRDHLIAEAKKAVLELAEAGYTAPQPAKVYAAGRDAKAALQVGVFMMRDGRYISDYDNLLANKLIHVLCGGNLTAPTFVDEQYILDLEREAVLTLVTNQKTVERIGYMLQNGKPLRN
jgi:3-hydroxyacyl-CoA dehydrogenase